jgi:hypothetical protein
VADARIHKHGLKSVRTQVRAVSDSDLYLSPVWFRNGIENLPASGVEDKGSQK